MNRWNPNFFASEGIKKGYNPAYLNALIERGKRISANNVPVLFSLSHLANYSQCQYAELHSIVSRAHIYREGYPYKNFPIKKRSGGVRWISVPVPPLMAVQSWIAKEILNNVAVHSSAYAYVTGLKDPILQHVRNHCASKWMLKVDIKNFFPNISEKQVYDVFRSLEYPQLLSFEMARLCTRVTPRRKGERWNTEWKDREIEAYTSRYIGSLPQGAPSSPALSNLVCRNFDEQLNSLSIEHDANYSRYADDLCFSFHSSNREKVAAFKKKVSLILWQNSFMENAKKTRIIPPGARKIVTGLVANENKPKISRELRDRVRMHLHYAEKNGIPSHCKNRSFRSVMGFKNHLQGLISYISSIDSVKGEEFKQKFDSLPWLDFDI